MAKRLSGKSLCDKRLKHFRVALLGHVDHTDHVDHKGQVEDRAKHSMDWNACSNDEQ